MRRSAGVAVIAGLLVVGVVAGCGGGADNDAAQTSGDAPDRTETTDRGAAAYVGLTKRAAIARAEASDTPWRVTREDDESFMVTQDFDPTRLNFEIDDGRVTTASYG